MVIEYGSNETNWQYSKGVLIETNTQIPPEIMVLFSREKDESSIKKWNTNWDTGQSIFIGGNSPLW